MSNLDLLNQHIEEASLSERLFILNPSIPNRTAMDEAYSRLKETTAEVKASLDKEKEETRKQREIERSRKQWK